MGINTAISAVVGYRFKLDHFKKTIPAVTELQDRFNPKTGMPVKPETVVIESEQELFVLPDGREFEDECDFAEEFKETLPEYADCDLPFDDKWIYVYVKLKQIGKNIDDGRTDVYAPIQEFPVGVFVKLEQLKRFLETTYGLSFPDPEPKLYIIYNQF